MHRTADGDLRVETNHPRHAAIDDGLLTAQVKWTNIGPAQRKVTAHALMKVGLGVLWLAEGPEETSQPRYDHVSDAVLCRASVPLKHGFGNSTFPNHALVVQVISDRLQTGLLVSLHYFATELWAQSLGYESRPQQSSSPETSIITTSTLATTSRNHQPLQVSEAAPGPPVATSSISR